MTSRAKRFLLFAVCVLAVGSVFWMRSLASWRPVKVGHVNGNGQDEHLSQDGRFLVQSEGVRGGGVVFHTFDIWTGHLQKWPNKPFPPFAMTWGGEEGWTGASYWSKPESDDETSDSALQLRNGITGKIEQLFHWNNRRLTSSSTARLSNDHKILWIVSNPYLLECHVATGKVIRQMALRNPLLEAYRESDLKFDLSLDCSRLIGHLKNQTRIWDTHDGHVIGTWKVRSPLCVEQVFPDASAIIYHDENDKLDDGQTHWEIYDSLTGKLMWKYRANTDFFLGMDSSLAPKIFDDQGNILFLQLKDNIEVRDARTGKILRHLSHPRQNDGIILRVTSDWIYTLNPKDEIFRWRAR